MGHRKPFPLRAAGLLLGLAEGVLGVMTLYVTLLTAAAFLARRRRVPESPAPQAKIAVLVPAHNEELLLGRLLESLAAQRYLPHLYEAYVVADNCTDSTAEVARRGGARLVEREEPRLAGKGYALRHLLSQPELSQGGYDAFVVVDADSTISPNFLAAMDARLAAGSQAIQAHYTVANPGESWSAGLRYAALALVHYLRPLGKGVFGGSAGLKGNGMCFAAPLLLERGWDSYSLVEDVEFHLRLLSSGVRVDFAPEATVWAQMPDSLREARSQNLRWERGRLEMLRSHVPGLLKAGVEGRNLAQIDGALEQLVPPFSVPVAASALGAAGAALLRSRVLFAGAMALLAGQLAYVAGGLVLVRAPARVYLSLLRAPLYVGWKVMVYLRAMGSGDLQWVRTPRKPSPRPSPLPPPYPPFIST